MYNPSDERKEFEKVLITEKGTIELLVPLDIYLAAGVHIGTHICTKHMEEFVYKLRPDGLYILNVRLIDERIRIAARFLSRFNTGSIVAISARQYGFKPVEMFAQLTGNKSLTGRFVPGTLTNPRLNSFIESEVVIVTDPRADTQALDEAAKVGIPVIAIASTDNKLSGIDLVIPGNNKGRKSLAVIYWLLTRQLLREKGILPPNGELQAGYEDFETKVG
ncbi:MAG: 30S ribosomal protein S2 [Sulfolobales archaeon]